jgi:hypothetical protein
MRVPVVDATIGDMRAPEPVDVGLAAGGLALSLPLAIPSAHATTAVALVLVQALALMFLRREPVRVLVAVLVLGAPLLAISPYLISLGPADIALCGVAWLRPPRVSLRALGALLLLAPFNLLDRGARRPGPRRRRALGYPAALTVNVGYALAFLTLGVIVARRADT